LLLAGCGDLAAPPPGAFLDSGVWDRGPVDCFSYAWCEEGRLYRIPPIHEQDSCGPVPELAQQFGVCEWGCATTEAIWCWPDAPCTLLETRELCYLPPESVTCIRAGECSSEGATEPCPAEVACGGLVQVGSCTCTDGAWQCAPACADGLCSAAEVLDAMVGTWQGMVDPPPFADPYPVTLEFLSDGHFIGDCPREDCTAFYYGIDGYHDLARVWVDAQTELGAFVSIELVFNEETDSTAVAPGLLRGLRIDGDLMTFTFIDAWLGCVRPFEFALQRVP